MEQSNAYIKGFIPCALAAFLIGIVGGFSTVPGPAFVQDLGIAYNNTTWTALAQAMSTAACAGIFVACLVTARKEEPNRQNLRKFDGLGAPAKPPSII